MDRLLCAILLFAIPTVSPCYSNDLSPSHHLCVFRSFFLVRPKIPATRSRVSFEQRSTSSAYNPSVSRKARKMIEWIENDNDHKTKFRGWFWPPSKISVWLWMKCRNKLSFTLFHEIVAGIAVGATFSSCVFYTIITFPIIAFLHELLLLHS